MFTFWNVRLSKFSNFSNESLLRSNTSSFTTHLLSMASLQRSLGNPVTSLTGVVGTTGSVVGFVGTGSFVGFVGTGSVLVSSA